MKPVYSGDGLLLSAKRVLMLLTDGHGDVGGIAQYNRDVLEALGGAESIDSVYVLARSTREDRGTIPEKVHYDASGSASRLSFAIRSVMIASRRQFDVVYCAHINLLPIARICAWIQGSPLILAVYGIDAWTPSSSPFVARSVRFCDCVLSISDVTLQRLRGWADLGRAKTFITPNAIRPERYGPGEKPKDLLDAFGLHDRTVIMTFGRLAASERYKGFDEVLHLLPDLRRKLTNLTYIIAGDGDDRGRLQALASELRVDDIVVFTGSVPEDRKADYYRLADAYVMPSRGEGFGFVILEALACGVPVVASDCDGTREAVRNGELGSIVDPSDPHSIEEGILTALSREKSVPEGLDYFSFPRFSQRLWEAFGSALGGSAGGRNQ